MPLLTIPQKIDIGLLSVSFAVKDILQSGYEGGGVDLELPRKIYCITKNCLWLYNLSPTDPSLVATTNYLIQLCGKYYLQANAVMGSGGSVIPPGTVNLIKSPIPITGSLFASTLSWHGVNNDGVNVLSSYFLQVFYNSLNKFITKDVDWTRTALGFDVIPNGVNIPSDFDALGVNSADIFQVFISA